MPCLDGREEQWAQEHKRRHDALIAIMCGIQQADEQALEFASEWYGYHSQADALRKLVKYDWEDSGIQSALAKADAVLDRAHSTLCV